MPFLQLAQGGHIINSTEDPTPTFLPSHLLPLQFHLCYLTHEKYYSAAAAPCQHDDMVQLVNYNIPYRKLALIVKDKEFMIDNACKFMSIPFLPLSGQASDIENCNWLTALRYHADMVQPLHYSISPNRPICSLLFPPPNS